jgi:hypothetical protein
MARSPHLPAQKIFALNILEWMSDSLTGTPIILILERVVWPDGWQAATVYLESLFIFSLAEYSPPFLFYCRSILS